jgi:hypothetical protein
LRPSPGSCPHAAPCLRLRAGKQGSRYPHAAGLSRPPQHSINRSLHRAGARAVQEHLEGLIDCTHQGLAGPGTAREIKRTSATVPESPGTRPSFFSVSQPGLSRSLCTPLNSLCTPLKRGAVQSANEGRPCGQPSAGTRNSECSSVLYAQNNGPQRYLGEIVMIRKLNSGQYRLYSRKINPKTERGAILVPSSPKLQPKSMNAMYNISKGIRHGHSDQGDKSKGGNHVPGFSSNGRKKAPATPEAQLCGYCRARSLSAGCSSPRSSQMIPCRE